MYSLIPKIRYFSFVLSQTFLILNKSIEKMDQYLEHQISFIKSTIKYVLLVPSFCY